MKTEYAVVSVDFSKSCEQRLEGVLNGYADLGFKAKMVAKDSISGNDMIILEKTELEDVIGDGRE